MTPILAFDIETIPDIRGVRKLHALSPDLPDADVAAMAFQLRRQVSGNDFLPLHLHKPCIGVPEGNLRGQSHIRWNCAMGHGTHS